jgi:hypothetical protein
VGIKRSGREVDCSHPSDDAVTNVWSWGPPSLLFSEYRSTSSWGLSGRGIMLTTHLSVAQVRNEWNYLRTPTLCLHGLDWDTLPFFTYRFGDGNRCRLQEV